MSFVCDSAGEGGYQGYVGEVAYPLGEDSEGEGGCAGQDQGS